MIWQVFLVLVVSQANVGHLNSEGWSFAPSYIRMDSPEECERLKPRFVADATARFDAWKAQPQNRYVWHRASITAECAKIEVGN